MSMLRIESRLGIVSATLALALSSAGMPAGAGLDDVRVLRARLLSAAATAQQAYIKPSNTDSSDEFGHAVSVSVDTAVIGAFL
jgi:hypothetical protein